MMQSNGSNARGKNGKHPDEAVPPLSALGGAIGGANSASGKPPKGGGKRFKFRINSDYVKSRDVQDQIMAAIEAVGFLPDDIFAIRLALEEAMINAIKHGNKLDASKFVKIDAAVSPETLEITIHDEGPGFDRSSVPDPLLEENLEKNSGRGILLIESYMNAAEWTDGGRRLRMTKTRNPAAATA